jgi:hypothetical protein
MGWWACQGSPPPILAVPALPSPIAMGEGESALAQIGGGRRGAACSPPCEAQRLIRFPMAMGEQGGAERGVVRRGAASWGCAVFSRPSPPPTAGRPPLSRPRSSSARRGGNCPAGGALRASGGEGWFGLVGSDIGGKPVSYQPPSSPCEARRLIRPSMAMGARGIHRPGAGIADPPPIRPASCQSPRSTVPGCAPGKRRRTAARTSAYRCRRFPTGAGTPGSARSACAPAAESPRRSQAPGR